MAWVRVSLEQRWYGFPSRHRAGCAGECAYYYCPCGHPKVCCYRGQRTPGVCALPI